MPTTDMECARMDRLLQNSPDSNHANVMQRISCKLHNRVSTNLTEQISRRLQEGFQEKSRTCLHCFGLLCNVPNPCCDVVCQNIEQKHDVHFIQHGAVAKVKRGRPVSTQINDLVPSFMTGNQCGRSPYTKISRRTSKFQEL